MRKLLCSILCIALIFGTFATLPAEASGNHISIDKATYAYGEQITVTYRDIPDEMIKGAAFIAIYKKGAPHKEYGPWNRPSKANGTLLLGIHPDTSPAGEYEVRLYRKDFVELTDQIFVMAVPFTVVTAATPVVTPSTPVVNPSTPIYAPIAPVATQATTGTKAEAISVGAKFSWPKQTGGLGWRLYRSEKSGVQGISVTDFYITSTDFIDVNVDANKTYYYILRQVLAEANPMQGIAEKLGPASSEMVVKTGSTILGGNASAVKGEKQFILMTLDDPLMTVNGSSMEVDPGRGTTPIVLNSRTLAPIRAIVENMGGSIGWDASSNTATINYNNRTVKMIIDQKYMLVDGVRQNIDVAPRSINQRTMLPVRFISDALGISIDYLNSTKQIVIVYIAL